MSSFLLGYLIFFSRMEMIYFIKLEQSNISVKDLPMEYQFLNLRMLFNKELYENKVISFDIFNRMQKLLTKKMQNLILDDKR